MDDQARFTTAALAAAALAVATLLSAAPAGAQTYTKLYTYPIDSRNHSGIVPPGLMAQGTDGNIYGTNVDDGPFAAGSAFSFTPEGQYTQIYAFCAQTMCLDGTHPTGGLTLGPDGNLYGTTTNGGKFNGGSGTIFSLTDGGALTKLYDFTSLTHDGGYPQYPPLMAANGDLYGAGSEVYAGHYGRVYKLTPRRRPPDKFSALVTFKFSNGSIPNMPALATNGDFYGTTSGGGDSVCRCGVIFRIAPPHKFAVLHRFVGYPSDGYEPFGALVEGNDGAFYGTTYAGGTYNQGTIFKIAANGKYTLLHSFQYTGTHLEGKNPVSGLTLGSDGGLYGTMTGGAHGYGAIYRVSTAGAVTLAYNFCPVAGCADGFSPQTPLIQHTNGKFYGSTAGNSLGGSVFYSLDLGLKPFVSLVTPSGRAGQVVEMLGQGLRNARGVSFNGTPARFAPASEGGLVTVVPAGATSGFVHVQTAGGVLTSNRAFVVTR